MPPARRRFITPDVVVVPSLFVPLLQLFLLVSSLLVPASGAAATSVSSEIALAPSYRALPSATGTMVRSPSTLTSAARRAPSAAAAFASNSATRPRQQSSSSILRTMTTSSSPRPLSTSTSPLLVASEARLLLPAHCSVRSRRFQSTDNGTVLHMSIERTPLGSTKSGAALLDGLDVHVVRASDDSHPLAVYGIDSVDVKPAEVAYSADGGGAHEGGEDEYEKGGRHVRHPVLLLHGRTWSSVPVYHLLGGPRRAAANAASADGGGGGGKESRSLMEALLASGLQPYAMDFRGFGGTPPDATHKVEPNRCVRDVETVLQWIARRHGLVDAESGEEVALRHCDLPALLGWSQGALVAQLAAQRSPDLMSKLVLYGSIYDPEVRYPRAPLYTSEEDGGANAEPIMNTFDAAIEDFTVEGTIPPEPARLFAEAALLTDPIKATWTHLHQFNNCDPARINVPTLVIAGDQDPYAPLRVQSELFTNLGRGADRTWSIMADADHAVHLLDGRGRFVEIVKNFVENGRRGSESGEIF